jgi:multimeric flavodoxin WrbA
MDRSLSRRGFVGTAGAAVAAGLAAGAAGAEEAAGVIKILGIATSYRKGKTTAAGVQACLDAAKAVSPERVEIELVELADYNIPGAVAAGAPVPAGQTDDFPKLAVKLLDPRVAGLVIGSPVYMGLMSGLCKTFIDRCAMFRKEFALSGKVGGALAVGGARNGGQERILQDLHGFYFGEEMVVVGDGKPSSHSGGTLWNHWKDDIVQDEEGMKTVRNLGKRVAEVALKLAAAQK